MIREVMRKIVSKELSPVIHKSSFNAYESIRTPLLGPDPVVEGFISHVDVVNVDSFYNTATSSGTFES